MGAAVEAELGLFGGGEGHAARVEKTSVEDSRRMVEETGIDTLAPAVGSVHGGDSRLDLPLLEEIASAARHPWCCTAAAASIPLRLFRCTDGALRHQGGGLDARRRIDQTPRAIARLRSGSHRLPAWSVAL